MIKVLLFDFYGVFIPDSFEVWLMQNSLKREGIFAELINQRDSGTLSEPDFLAKLSLVLEREVKPDEIHINDPRPDKELIGLLRSLKPQYKIGLFSNASSTLRVRLDSFGISDLFDEIIISSEIGHAKPSDEAFVIAIKKLGVASGEILFVDDNPKNIEAALKNNMHACLYGQIDDLQEAVQLLELNEKN